ncbi:MAG: Bug family tripartite tricarboxylate transporter substrate binding protein [Burkholderiales bacterium]
MIRAALVLLAMQVTAGPVALAQTYPVKPVRLIVPAPPGSVTDVRARWIVEKLAPTFGQPIIVENRGGAGGVIGTEAVAKSAPDGYTILLAHQGTHAINPHIYARPGYDALTDFAPITRLVLNPLVLAVHPDLPVKSVAELIKLARDKPGQLFFGSPGNGTPPHLAGELFKRMADIDVAHVPFKGGAQAQAELIAGRIAFTVEGVAIQLQQVKAGRLRALAVTGAERVSALPDTPTIAEAGVPGYEYQAWTGIVAPAGTPRAIVDKLQGDIARALHTPETREWLTSQGAVPGGESPEAFATFIKAEHAKWGKVVREAGIKAD